jgi:hypothetical protein
VCESEREGSEVPLDAEGVCKWTIERFKIKDEWAILNFPPSHKHAHTLSRSLARLRAASRVCVCVSVSLSVSG